MNKETIQNAKDICKALNYVHDYKRRYILKSNEILCGGLDEWSDYLRTRRFKGETQREYMRRISNIYNDDRRNDKLLIALKRIETSLSTMLNKIDRGFVVPKMEIIPQIEEIVNLPVPIPPPPPPPILPPSIIPPPPPPMPKKETKGDKINKLLKSYPLSNTEYGEFAKIKDDDEKILYLENRIKTIQEKQEKSVNMMDELKKRLAIRRIQ